MLNGNRKIAVSLEYCFCGLFFFLLSLEFQKMTTAPFDSMLVFLWKFIL